MKALSYAQGWTFAGIGEDWSQCSDRWPTLNALERKGLIEVRMTPASIFYKEARLTETGRDYRRLTRGHPLRVAS